MREDIENIVLGVANSYSEGEIPVMADDVKEEVDELLKILKSHLRKARINEIEYFRYEGIPNSPTDEVIEIDNWFVDRLNQLEQEGDK